MNPLLGSPLAGGYLDRVQPNATPAQIANALNDVIIRLNEMLKVQVSSDATTKRYLSGYQAGGFPGGDFGIKISRPGVDVTTATYDQLIFMWDFTAGTQYWYDATSGKNYRQDGILPNGVGGQIIMKPGYNVAEAF